MNVRVAGRGIAAASAVQCLAARGIPVVTDAHEPGARQAPVVMLGEQAQALLADVFAGNSAVTEVMACAHRIERRVVRWGTGDPQVFAHAGLVIGGDDLIPKSIAKNDLSPSPSGEGLGWGLSPSPQQSGDAPPPTPPLKGRGEESVAPRFTVTTIPPAKARLLRFGTREAAAVPVELSRAADRGAALVEALGEGWLFLIPTGGDRGWLLAVGAEPDHALRQSRLVAPAVAATGTVSAHFETAPRLLDDPCASGMLTLGSGAIALDPICGDGTATAVRGGILAAAVAAAMTGADHPTLDPARDGDALTAHYRAMMIAAMRRHLTVSWPFYARGGDGAWWRAEADALAEGHAWCTRQLAAAGEARFVLAGDRLIPRELVA